MKCHRCQQEHLPQAKFCLQCGTPVDGAVPIQKSYADLKEDLNRLKGETQELRRSLAEALERQTATSEILRVISSSPTDMQPVMDAVAKNAARVCGAADALIFHVEGGALHRVAQFGSLAVNVPTVRRISRETPPGRAILERRTIHIEDIVPLLETEYPLVREAAIAVGARTHLAAPLIREEVPIGAILIRRTTVQPFTDRQIELLETFAAQAVIAIENVRLFTELQASHRDLTTALDKQTATSDILRVISQSPTHLNPVFQAIVDSAARLLGAYTSTLFRVSGDQIDLAAYTSTSPADDDALQSRFPASLSATPSHAVCVRERTPFHTTDAQCDPRLAASAHEYARTRGYRSQLVVPMRRRDDVIGTISVTRREGGGFAPEAISLLQTFADQAVIAIENVRLFTELQASNRDLTTALDTQTATSEILRVISGSRTDVQPVFDTIVASAVRLLGAYSGSLTRRAGDQIELVALTSTDDAGNAAVRARYPQPLQSEDFQAQVLRDRAPLIIADVQTDPRLPEATSAYARARGWRSAAMVPMLRPGEAVGTISVTRRDPGGFTNDEIALLQTFADQAVIAIENTRLLSELQTRTDELTRSVDQLTALGEVGRAVSSTLDLETVLTTIVSRAVQLSGLDRGVVFEYDESTEEFVWRASTAPEGAPTEARRTVRLRKGEGVVGQTAITLEPAQVADITVPGVALSPLRANLIASGIRAILAVLVREGRVIGGLVVERRRPGEFPAETIELLRRFATQSALAIQNARLFHEIEDKSRQLEVASQHKSEFLANMSHELRTPLNAVIGFSEVLSEGMFGQLNEKQEEYARDIYSSGQHLLSLINDILDLSKIEAGRMELEVSEFDLPAALDNALTLVRERASRRGIALSMTVDERLGEIRADERKIRQVVLNLLSNAIKFTPEGGRIEVRAAPVDGSVEVSVTDTGVGIAPEDQEAIFEEFKQVGTAAKKVEGTGLGLALSRKFIELHGGRIWVKSTVGVGSTFTFSMPVAVQPDQVGP